MMSQPPSLEDVVKYLVITRAPIALIERVRQANVEIESLKHRLEELQCTQRSTGTLEK